MTLDQALSYIHSVTWRGSVPDLSRTRELLSKMGDPQNRLKFIHVAGTNGKGSTCAMLSSILQKAGYKTGLYTSPYINRFHERMQVNGEPISDDELCRITEFVRPLADAMEDVPTEFELVTCIGFEFFARRQCEIVVLECGMGGEFDSTNVIEVPECAVLCTIGMDHMQYLGHTHAEIARTKAGIFKPGGVCVTYPGLPEVDAVYREAADERELTWIRADFGRLHPVAHSLRGQAFDFDGFGRLHLSLLGRNQLCNCAMALHVVEALRQKGWAIPDDAVRDGLSAVAWPGRFELLCRRPDVIVDGCHNVQCMLSLKENIMDYLPGREIIAVTGVMADKEYEKMYFPVMPLIRRFITVEPPNPRALPAPELARALQGMGADAQSADTVEDGVRAALALARPDDCILAFGSLYMLGKIRSCIFDMQKLTKQATDVPPDLPIFM